MAKDGKAETKVIKKKIEDKFDRDIEKGGKDSYKFGKEKTKEKKKAK